MILSCIGVAIVFITLFIYENRCDKYLLVKNERETGYQLVEGVYKFEKDEKIELENRF